MVIMPVITYLIIKLTILTALVAMFIKYEIRRYKAERDNQQLTLEHSPNENKRKHHRSILCVVPH